MPSFSYSEFLIIFTVILLLFGAKRIPEIRESMRRGTSQFRSEGNLRHALDIRELVIVSVILLLVLLANRLHS